MFVQFQDEQSNNIDRVMGHIKLRRDFERTFNAEKMVEESSVWAIVDASMVGELRLIGRHERVGKPLGPGSCHLLCEQGCGRLYCQLAHHHLYIVSSVSCDS